MHLARPVASAAQALDLLADTLNQVEDELSGIPYQPEMWLNDGRMYPPRSDSAREIEGRPDLTRYRSRNHNIWIATNGTVLIQSIGSRTFELDIPGVDGCRIELT